MATPRVKKKAEEDELTVCPICLERFKNPKYLPCLHTFCEVCLNKYITSGYTSKATGFLCPTCRTFTQSSTKGLRRQKWAENFPLNHLIISLIDREKSREKNKICDPCARGDIQSKAEHWCQNCSEALCPLCKKYHLTNKFTSSHSIITLDDLGKDGDAIHDPDIICPHHTDKKIETYCYDHDMPCCVVCLTVHHRSCHKVNTINEAKKEKVITSVLQSLKTSFLHIDQQLQQNVNDCTRAEKATHKSKLKIEAEIIDLKRTIHSHIDMLANKLQRDVSSVHSQHSEDVRKRRKGLQEKSSIAHHCIKVIETCQESKIQNVHILMELKTLKSKEEELKSFNESVTAKMKNINMELEVADGLSNLTSSVKSFGRILTTNGKEEKKGKPPETTVFNLKSSTPQLTSSVSISRNELVSSAVFLPTGHVLAVYWSSSKMTVIDGNGKCISSLELGGNPCDLTLVTSQQAIATLPDRKQLVYIDIDPSSLSLTVLNTVTLHGRCRGICRDGQTLLVTYPTQLNVLGLGGDIINIINVQGCRGLFFINKYKDNIYLSDFYQHCVLCINNTGTEIFRYLSDKLRHPCKLANDCEGNIYVAGFSSNNIHQLSSDGTLIRIIPLQLKDPTCVAFVENGNEFFISTLGDKIAFYTMK